MKIEKVRTHFRVELENSKVFYLKEKGGALNISVDGQNYKILPEPTGFSNVIRIDQIKRTN